MFASVIKGISPSSSPNFVESEAFTHVAIDVYSHKHFFLFQDLNEGENEINLVSKDSNLQPSIKDYGF